MEKFELVPLHNGVISLRSLGNHETFHPGIGPAEEAKLLHVDQQKIVEAAGRSKDFVLWDVGLGAAANALAAVRAWERDLPADYSSPLTIESFDKTTAPLDFALRYARELGYPLGFEAELRQLIDTGTTRIGQRIRWNLHLGDFSAELPNFSLRAPDAIFYDPYSVKSNEEMWSLAHFSRLFAKLDPERPCLMTSYTASTYIRVTLLLAGFQVAKGCQIDKKLHTTIVSNRLDLLEHPLDREWLTKRVRISHSAAPIREFPHKIAPLGEAEYATLLGLPQFAE